jgi:hypothetical protein
MGANPGHIRREIINDLPYPRDEASPAFRRIVQQTHAIITEALMPDTPTHAEPAAGMSTVLPRQPTKEPPIETLPNIQIVDMIGLLGVDCRALVGLYHGTAEPFDGVCLRLLGNGNQGRESGAGLRVVVLVRPRPFAVDWAHAGPRLPPVVIAAAFRRASDHLRHGFYRFVAH